MEDQKTPVEKRLKRVNSAWKEFPVIGEPGADKIVLFAGLVPVAAVPSAQTGAPQRIFFGAEDKNYGKGYRASQEAMHAELPQHFAARKRAYLLLKKHGQEICKRTKPRCEKCARIFVKGAEIRDAQLWLIANCAISLPRCRRRGEVWINHRDRAWQSHP